MTSPPSREDRRRPDGARPPVDRPRQAHAGADQLGLVDTCRDAERFDDLDGRVDRVRRRVVDVDFRAVLAENGRREVGQRDPDAVVVEVDADGDSGGAVEAQEGGRPPAAGMALAVGLLDHEASCLEIGDQAADRRARQAGQPGEVAPAHEAVAAKRVENENAVAFAKDACRALAVELSQPNPPRAPNSAELRA